jgi:N-acetylglucosamine-6-phosphate deacetylase
MVNKSGARSDVGISPFAIQGRLLLGPAGATTVDGALVIHEGKIVSIDVPVDPDRLPARRLRAPFIAPGLIDLQINGAFGFEVGTHPETLLALAARLPSTGVTAFLPTLVSRKEAEYPDAFAAFDEAIAQRTGSSAARAAATVLGLHLEGPLLAPTRAGAHTPDAIDSASAALIDRLSDPERVRVVTLAPERPEAIGLIARLRARGVIVSLGHTDASFETCVSAIDAGATLATHIFNAMSPFHHRAPGATGAALTDDRVTALIIADGIHTHPAALRLAIRAKGSERLALVTDAIAGTGLPPGPTTLAGRAVTVDRTSARLADGTLAGSILTLDQAVRNAVAFAGLSEAAAVHLASGVPARALGLTNKGHLSVGADADIVLLDHDLGVMATFVGGLLGFSRDFPDSHDLENNG